MKFQIVTVAIGIFITSSLPFQTGFLYGSNDLQSNDFLDTIDDLEDNLFTDDKLLEEFLTALPTTSTRQINVKSILGLLKSIGAFSILDQDFYLRTNPLVQRSLLDLPVFEIHQCKNPDPWIVGAHLFWNHLDRAVFTCKSTSINSYLDLEQQTLFAALDEITPQIKTLFPQASIIDDILNTAHVTELLSLFENFTIQQRRVGIMFHLWRQWKRAELRLLLPFYYLERNLYATPAEQHAIEDQFGVLDPTTATIFQKNHAISDALGFGDTRVEADYALYLSDDFVFRAGALVTLPTAFAISSAIRGSNFLTDLQQPTFDLQSLFDLIPEDYDINAITPEARQTAQEIVIGDICKNKKGFLLGALDRLNALILDSSLGNGHHLGIGALIRFYTRLSALLDEFEWAQHISFHNRFSIEYLTPATKTRFFIKRNTAADFEDRDFDSDDPKEQEANLLFVQSELVNKFYPFAIKATVQPGIILRWTNRWCFSGDVWDIAIGSDFWLQRKEKLSSFKCTDSAVLSRLDIANGQTSLAYQFKSMAGFGIKIQRPTLTGMISINAEGTTWSKNIGKDITATLNIEFNF